MVKEVKAGAKPPKSSALNTNLQQQIMEVLVRAIKYRKVAQKHLNTDDAGLSTMIHLAIGDTDSPTGIAQNLDTSTAATTLVLNRLESAGHITRTPHPKDKRKVVLVPTKDSLASVAQLAKPISSGIADLTTQFTKSEQEVVSRFLEGVIKIYDNALPKK